jgi:hypothetical protein
MIVSPAASDLRGFASRRWRWFSASEASNKFSV